MKIASPKQENPAVANDSTVRYLLTLSAIVRDRSTVVNNLTLSIYSNFPAKYFTVYRLSYLKNTNSTNYTNGNTYDSYLKQFVLFVLFVI